MKGLLDFALYNLAGSLMAGLLAWMMVMAALRLLSVRTPFLYASFLALPLVKSGLVLLGIGLVFPWGGFAAWQQRAVSPGSVLPFVLLWFGLALAAYYWLVARARADVLRHASPPPDRQEDRLQGALDRIAQAYRQTSCCEAGETVCCIADQVPANPRLLVSDWLRSPAALVEGGTPVILFPKALVELLDDHELTLALAHELNHFALRKPGGWSAGNLRILALVSPVALLLADELSRAEEKACDDLAVRMLGMPEVYAGMLIRATNFLGRDRPQKQRSAYGFYPG